MRNVLLHEQKLGYTDRATVGGLAGFWERWLPALRSLAPTEAARGLIEQSSSDARGYAAADQTERALILARCLTLLDCLRTLPPDRALAKPAAAETTRPEVGPAPLAPTTKDTTFSLRIHPDRPVAPPPERPDSAPRRQNADAHVGRVKPVQATESHSPAAPPPQSRNGARGIQSTPTPDQGEPGRATGAVAAHKPTPVRSGGIEAPVASLRGVGPAFAVKLAKLGISSIRDLLYHFPTRHIDYRDTRPIAALRPLGEGQFQTIQATVVDVRVEPLRGHSAPAGQWLFADVPEPRAGRSGLLRISARLRDETGAATAVWIRAQDYVSREFSPGRLVMVSGEVHATWRGEEIEFRDPDYEFVASDDSINSIHTGRLVPVYRLTQSLGARGLRRIVKLAVDAFAPQLHEFLPLEIRRAANLLDLPTAIGQIHFPDTPELLERAHRRLVFDEFFLVQFSLLERREEWKTGPPGPRLTAGRADVDRFVASLPFQLTGAQRRVLDEVVHDIAGERPMSRLIQGDVGSGKTVVAAAAALAAVANGCQAAVMAPTEILAEQHYRTFQQLVGEFAVSVGGEQRPVRLALLVGSQKPKEKQATRQAVASGEVDVVVGTQALIQESVAFRNLGLAVVDEQHRFGVLQRGALRDKGDGQTAHLLVMTATPIPRTLALTVYGDLDLSLIDELPPGRQEIRTKCFGPGERAAVYEGLRHEVRAGHQAFVICPLVEESERLEAKAATAEFDRLSADVFPDLRLGLLHGKLKPAEKESAMRAFQRGETDVLVATAVVEVGVDVPNATFMIVEGAERFGLAQLHQFRGRIGRGSARSYCALLAGDSAESTSERLAAVAGTRDGFRLAEADLRLRGPGEFFGTRQSGLPDLKLARPGDETILEEARVAAGRLFAEPALLHSTEREALASRVRRLWEGGERH